MSRHLRLPRCLALMAGVLAGAMPAAAQDAGRMFGGEVPGAAVAAGAGGWPGAAGAGGAGADAGFGASGAGLPGLGAPGIGGGSGLPGRARGGLPTGVPGLPANRTADGTDAPAAMRALPPLEPNDFQRFVQAGTGRLLPMFGASLFEEAPASFAPVGSVPVPAEYVIGPGDEVIVRSTGVLDFELRPVVDRDGQIVLPKVGAVQIAGVRMGDLETVLAQQVGKSFRNFTLSATLGQLRGIDVYVVGQARRPGKYTLSSLSTLVNALFASGGPNANGSMRAVRLVRANRPVATVDLYDFIVSGDKSKDLRLLPGDVIVFPSAGPRVALVGALNVPAVYELSGPEASIQDVLALSGGLPVMSSPLRAQLERIDPTQKAARVVETFALDAEGRRRRLRDGDVLTVMPISPQFANAVTLRGNVAQPLRHPHVPGMRVRDLIPDRDALITRDYWLRQNLMVQFEDARTQAQERDVRKDAAARDAGQAVTAEKARQEVLRNLDEVNWDYAVIERLDAVELKTRLIPFNLGRVVLGRDDSQNHELQPGDVVTIFSQRDLRVPRARQTRMVRVEGEVAAPGIYSVEPGETLPQLIARIGGTTREAYVFGTELTRESVQRQQQENLKTVVKKLEDQVSAGLAARQATLQAGDANQRAVQAQRLEMEEKLARERLQRLASMKPTGRIALELDPAVPSLPDMTLEDGDRVIVPPRPSFVTVVGSVYNENVLLWRSGRSVREYLDSAGLTEGADVDNVFVLRADGSIASRKAGGWLGGGSGSVFGLALAPGDTVVVPEKVDRETK
ncbi:MAG TPA: SLBB domain-containing protein, partial [Burkholderiaceae bacterium]|nr:SLBB domain-containing protein [Burkholderiaceae bacterium]